MTTKQAQQEQAEAITRLREWLKPGDTVYTILRHRSASGMSRSISLILLRTDGGVYDLDYNAARALDYKIDQKNGGLKVGGCGMDMGFHVVYSLSRKLFPHGFGIKGEHENGPKTPLTPGHALIMKSEGVKFYGRNGDTSGWDDDGGYALNQRWL